jgi:hypothetical protein
LGTFGAAKKGSRAKGNKTSFEIEPFEVPQRFVVIVSDVQA